MTLWLMMMPYHTKFTYKRFHYIVSKQTFKQVLNMVIQYFHTTFWIMMIYHQAKFGCQKNH